MFCNNTPSYYVPLSFNIEAFVILLAALHGSSPSVKSSQYAASKKVRVIYCLFVSHVEFKIVLLFINSVTGFDLTNLIIWQTFAISGNNKELKQQ